jgi:hypothetical protein
MTTIAANREMMAADSLVVVGDLSFPSIKLVRFEDAIIGAAGDSDACHLFFEWWPIREKSRFKLPKEFELEALVLTHSGLYRYGTTGKADVVSDGLCAIGSGASLAIASLDTQVKMGHSPDPRIAVEMACLRNPNSALPVQYYTLDQPYEHDTLPVMWGVAGCKGRNAPVQAMRKKGSRRT